MKRRGNQPDARPVPRSRPVSTDADRELWQLVASRIEPLRKAKARVPDVEAPATAALRRKPAQSAERPSATPARVTATPAPPPRAERSAVTRPAPLPAGIDRRKTRRIAKGHIEIGDRLDLHGMTQAAAERRLRAFLLDARAHGISTVLVITGKGGTGDSTSRRDGGDGERGVLRRAVPLWLESPQLRDSVVGYVAAHPRHGGAGALYIHLRKPDRRPK